MNEKLILLGLILIAFAFFVSNANATDFSMVGRDTNGICADFGNVEVDYIKSLGFNIIADSNCTCYSGIEKSYGSWVEGWCQEGKRVTQRKVFVVDKPNCSINYSRYTTEKVLVEFAPCKACKEPDVVSDWQTVSCKNGFALKQRVLSAESFNNSVDKCIPSSPVELEWFEEKNCSTLPIIGGSAQPSVSGLFYFGIVMLICFLIAYIIYKVVRLF